MSNPAVLVLATLQDANFPYRFEVEDNIGEAIHIHYKELRFDLTIEEFYELVDELGELLNKILEIEGFNYVDYDEVAFFNVQDSWTRLEKVVMDEIFLEDILVDTYNNRGERVIDKLIHSRVLKALNGNTTENDYHFEINYFKKNSIVRYTNAERINYVVEQVKSLGYPSNRERITLFGDRNIIMDGQHRAACLYHLYGNIKVPIRRVYFNGKDGSILKEMPEQICNKNCTQIIRSVHLFPFEFIEKGTKNILYGAGNVGREFLEQIMESNWCDIICIIDKKYKNFKKNIVPVVGLDILDYKFKYDYIIISIDCKEIVEEVKGSLIQRGISEEQIVSMWDR